MRVTEKNKRKASAAFCFFEAPILIGNCICIQPVVNGARGVGKFADPSDTETNDVRQEKNLLAKRKSVVYIISVLTETSYINKESEAL